MDSKPRLVFSPVQGMGWAMLSWGQLSSHSTKSDDAGWRLCRLRVPCDSTEWEMHHLYPAFAQPGQECYLQKEPLLFSCAGASTKYQRLCPCRDFLKGQVALCQGCL